MVSHKPLRTKSPVHKRLRDIETAILIKLQSIGNIPFSNNNCNLLTFLVTLSAVDYNIYLHQLSRYVR